ncbi:hypothetical protein BJ878DRAFT_544825 [Calycina marina]|uniref:Copper acquisition factor BIM1-like domain-containing protein n=1 Tax=Calycina marina TaxID=1763456 RepID=A0A9P7YZ70_9HELO|nr:hypothetical protein BJ878DRAFT_544825 [Calycina marina]
MLSRCAAVVVTICLAVAVDAHIVLTYPGWRGDNLITNDTFPYGMQWMYPCGGHPTTTNRTLWPVTGGAISLQPGWFQGHATAFFYMNLGYGTDGPGGGPPNMSFPMVPVFQIVGPSKNPYPGTFCLPQVPLPAGANVKIGDNATIQVVETAIHGAALYSCVDITFADPEDVAEVNSSNCFNSTDLSFNNVYSIPNGEGTTSFASRNMASFSSASIAAVALWAFL